MRHSTLVQWLYSQNLLEYYIYASTTRQQDIRPSDTSNIAPMKGGSDIYCKSYIQG